MPLKSEDIYRGKKHKQTIAVAMHMARIAKKKKSDKRKNLNDMIAKARTKDK